MNTQEFARLARAQVGKPYVLGAEAKMGDPNPPRYDCSELVQWLYFQAGIKSPTFTDGAWLQYKATSSVKGTPKVGDLVFLRNNPARPNGIGHVGVVTAKRADGDWEIVEAKGRRFGVVRSTLSYWKKRSNYAGLRRTSRLKLTSPVTPPVTPPVPQVPDVLPVIKLGSKGDDVSKLEALLIKHGYLVGVDGDFDARTELALKSFQRLMELPVRGITSDADWKALEGPVLIRLKMTTIREGRTNSTTVKAAQRSLNELLSSGLTVDGDFGPATKAAVKKIQELAKIEADGIVGPQTWLWLGYK